LLLLVLLCITPTPRGSLIIHSLSPSIILLLLHVLLLLLRRRRIAPLLTSRTRRMARWISLAVMRLRRLLRLLRRSIPWSLRRWVPCFRDSQEKRESSGENV
jgi:hypothetical protein